MQSDVGAAIRALLDSQGSINTLIERMATHTINNDSQSTATSSNPQPLAIRLPRIEIPEFDGSYTKYIRFRDLFESIIHNRTNISKVEKLHYLQTKLSGEVLGVIKHLQPTNDNYPIAWEMVKQRYDKSDNIKKAYLELLFDQPQMQSSSVGEVKRILNHTTEMLYEY